MIRQLSTRDVGPTRKLDLEFARRLNILTGDNGLGKTFILDVLWWVLTGTWARGKAYPWRPGAMRAAPTATVHPEINALLTPSPDGVGLSEMVTGGLWSWARQEWVSPSVAGEIPDGSWLRTPTRMSLRASQPARDLTMTHFNHASLVVYVRLDGTYATWDPNLSTRLGTDLSEGATVLTNAELWNGREVEDDRRPGASRTEIRGMISDWVTWQQRPDSREIQLFRSLLKVLSPPDEPLDIGEPTRVDLRDRRDIPTLLTPFSEVPVTLASAGVARVLSIAYLLTWAWTEHLRTSTLTQRRPTRHMVVLFDEPELHLHPSWQRGILPSILQTVEHMGPELDVQLFATTHSPLVMASVESLFNGEHDSLFVLERDGDSIRADARPFTKEGDVSNWLSSDVFGRVGGRSREAQLAVEAAMDFMAERHEDAEGKLDQLYDLVGPMLASFSEEGASGGLRGFDNGQLPLHERVHRALMSVLPGHDEFWAHWSIAYRSGRKTHRGDVR